MPLELSKSVTQDKRVDNRVNRRTRTLKKARIVARRAYTTLDCVIRDGTDNGARLKVQSQLHIPDEFCLMNDTDDTSIDCSIVWRRGHEIGVRYLNAVDTAPLVI